MSIWNLASKNLLPCKSCDLRATPLVHYTVNFCMKKREKHAGLAQQINGFGPAFLLMQRGVAKWQAKLNT
jgi:hypothetical protein